MAGPVLELRSLHKEIPRKDREPFKIFQDINISLARRRVRQHRRAQRLWQNHHAARHQRPDDANQRRYLYRRQSRRGTDHELVMGFVFQGASLLPWRTSLKTSWLGLKAAVSNTKEAGRDRAASI